MTPHDSALAIEARGLGRTFETRRKAEGLRASLAAFFRPDITLVEAVADLDMTVGEGELIGFLGPNGAGKTTTLKMFSGLIPPTTGGIRVLGHEPFRRERSFLLNISLVMGQKQNLWWDLPPIETLALHRVIYDIPEPEYERRLGELVEMLEIGDCLQVQARKLSLGQRMRCELACALLHQPRILFLDEPTIGLDILMQRKIRSFLLEYHARFRPTLLLTSHNMDDVAALCRRIIVVNLGRKRFDGPLAELAARARPEKILNVTFTSVPDGFDPARFGTVVRTEGPRFHLKVDRTAAPRIAAELFSAGGVLDLTMEDPPLEDALAEFFTAAPPKVPEAARG